MRLAGRGTRDRAGHRAYAAQAEDRSGHRRNSACQRDGERPAEELAFLNDSILETKVEGHAGFWWDGHGCRAQSLTQTAQEKLRQLVARIEKLEEEKKSIGDDIKETYAEAKATGFDSKVLRQVVRFRKQDRQEREEQEQIRELYLHALGEI